MDSTKKLYSVSETYLLLSKLFRTMKYMTRAKRNNELSPQFIERIMLAVTEVNGCPLCSYVHTKKALEQGVNNAEIQKLLSGIVDGIPADEVAAVVFAQHYADSRGNPSMQSWQRLVEIYGISKAEGILGAVCNIMFGNAVGLAISAFKSRLKAEPDHRSSLPYEVGMILSIVILLPVAFLDALLSDLFGVPITNFEVVAGSKM